MAKRKRTLSILLCLILLICQTAPVSFAQSLNEADISDSIVLDELEQTTESDPNVEDGLAPDTSEEEASEDEAADEPDPGTGSEPDPDSEEPNIDDESTLAEDDGSEEDSPDESAAQEELLPLAEAAILELADNPVVTNWTDLVTAVNAGGSVYIGADIDATSTASLKVSKDTVVYGNGYTLDGQGKYGFFVTKGGELTIHDLVMTNALRSSKKKGAVAYAYSGGITLINCVVTNSKDTYSSSTAVVYGSSKQTNLVNCTIFNNSRGVRMGSSGGSIANSVIVGNNTDITFSGSTAVDGGYNVIGIMSSAPAGFGSAEGSVCDSQYSDYDSWLDDDGYPLQIADSPILNKIPTTNPNLPEYDIDGIVRPQGELADIGAYEAILTDKTVVSLEITILPATTTYEERQSFSKSGMVVTATFNDGSYANIKNYTYTPAGPLTLADTEILITYGGAEVRLPIAVVERIDIDTADALEAAVTNAVAGDTIYLDGDILLTASTSITINKNLTIDGNGHTIDGQGNYYLRFAQTAGTFSVKNLAMNNMKTGSNASTGNLIYNSTRSTRLELENCLFLNNSTYNGAVWTYFAGDSSNPGTLIVTNCTFINNVASYSSTSSSSGSSGGIWYYYRTNLTFSGNIMVGNRKSNTAADLVGSTTGSSASTLNGGYNIIGATFNGSSTTSYWSSSAAATNQIGASYNAFDRWLDGATGELIDTLAENHPAVDAIPLTYTNVPERDFLGTERPVGNGYDIGAMESILIDAQEPQFILNLDPLGEDEYVYGEPTPTVLKVEAKVDDGGELSYQWYEHGFDLDAVTSATMTIEGATESEFTPPTDILGFSEYFVIVYNTNNTVNGEQVVYNVSEKRTVKIVPPGGAELSGITVTSLPEKTEYVEGQLFDYTGLAAAAVYGGTEIPLSDSSYTYTPAGPLTLADDTITLEYQGFSTTIPITVIPKVVERLALTAPPAKTKYYRGDTFSTVGMIITAHFNDEDTLILSDEDYQITPDRTLVETDEEVVISYDGQALTIAIQVTEGISNFSELQDAITEADTGDTIYLVQDLLFAGEEALTIFQVAAVNKELTIDGNDYTIDMVQKSGFLLVTGGQLTLKNLTIQNSATNINNGSGAALSLTGDATVNLENCRFINNEAQASAGGGGAIGINNSSLLAENTRFLGNGAAGFGGALYITTAGGSAEVTNSVFYANRAANGSAIALNSVDSNTAVLNLNSSTIAGNTGTGFGTGAAVYQSGENAYMFLFGNIVAGNSYNAAGVKSYGDFSIAAPGNVINNGYNATAKVHFRGLEQTSVFTGSGSSLDAEYAYYTDYLTEGNLEDGGLIPLAAEDLTEITVSPVLDKIPARNEYLPATDINGTVRPQNGYGDLGAHEQTVTRTYTITATAKTGGTISPAGAVSVPADGSITFTITPNPGYKVSNVIVDGISKGEATEYTFESVAEHHTIEAAFKSTTSSSSGGGSGSSSSSGGGSSSSNPSNTGETTTNTESTNEGFSPGNSDSNQSSTAATDFVDVNQNSWYYEAVSFVLQRNLFAGTSESTFSPEETASRAMIVTVLHRLAGLPQPQAAGTQFHDVAEDAYYHQAVLWAQGSGVIAGYGDATFAPDDLVTRQQVAVILYNFAIANDTALDTEEQTEDSLSRFNDASQIADWAADALAWAIQAGILAGNADGSLAPQATATRAELAAMVQRFAELN